MKLEGSAFALAAALLGASTEPAAAQDPVVRSYEPNPVRAGAEIRIRGTELAGLGRELRFGTDDTSPIGRIPTEGILAWTPTEIRLRLPAGLESGRYWIAVYGPEGKPLSNRLRTLDVQAVSGRGAAAPVTVRNPEITPSGPVVAPAPVAPIAPRSFRCGPHLVTYSVRSLDERYHAGVRCVLFDPADRDRFAWYGEGVVATGLRYRHLGLHTIRGGSRYDIFGNGEAFANSNRFALGFSRERIDTPLGPVPGRIMDRSGGGEWILEEDGTVEGWGSNLGPVEECGRHLRQYTAADDVDLTGAPREGSGVRCVFPGKTMWYGEGDWGGTRYVHLGLKDEEGNGAMAADVCDPTKSESCQEVPMDGIELGWRCLPRLGAVETVSGAWRERWIPRLRGLWDVSPPGDLRCALR